MKTITTAMKSSPMKSRPTIVKGNKSTDRSLTLKLGDVDFQKVN
jgi:hypothetical protein